MSNKRKDTKKEPDEVTLNKPLTFEDAEMQVEAQPAEVSEEQHSVIAEDAVDLAATEAEPDAPFVSAETLNEQEAATPDPQPSVKAQTHSKKTQKKHIRHLFSGGTKRWPKYLGMAVGVLAFVTLLTSGVLSQYFKGKTLPNVRVAGIASSAKKPTQLKSQLQDQTKNLKVYLQSDGKKLEPTFEQIGFQIDVDKTIANAMQAKRSGGIVGKLAFWQRTSIPAVVSINDTLLNQYLETNAPELSKPPQDAQLKFNSETNTFVISSQADGQGANTKKLKQQLLAVSNDLKSRTLKVGIAVKGPNITEAKLRPLVEPANSLVSRRIVLTGLGYTYQARPTDIASWVTPTPKDNGDIKLVIDPAKIQSYVDSIGKKISNAPVDRKVLKDEASGVEVVLQEGRDGTELADKSVLADAIAQSLSTGQDTTQTMNIKVAAYQSVNMNAYDKWIEVDLSEQRTTAYERATPIKNFLIASGTRGHETVTGEFAIWLKVRSQTMQGGSKADGSYYNIPNVEWVSYFYQDYALHGAWWRKQFGTPASHGCVNMTNQDAQWVFEWAPVGTKVIVHA